MPQDGEPRALSRRRGDGVLETHLRAYALVVGRRRMDEEVAEGRSFAAGWLSRLLPLAARGINSRRRPHDAPRPAARVRPRDRVFPLLTMAYYRIAPQRRKDRNGK